MKRVLVALLSCLTAFACLAGTVACGDDKKTNDVPNNNVSTSTDDASKDDASKEEAKPVGGCEGNCNWVAIDAVQPTCTEDGRAKTVQCTECDYIVDPSPVLLEKSAYLSETEYQAAKEEYISYWRTWSKLGNAHDWVVANEYKAPDCCNAGENVYSTCTICGINDKTEEEIVIPATNVHTKEDFVEYTHAIPATCTEDGRTEGWVCKNGGEKTVDVIPAFGHTYEFDAESEDFVAGTVAPTCTTDAECGRCGIVLEGTALGHDYVSVDAKAATCLEAGWEAYEYCANEGCAHTTFNFEAAAEMTAAKHWDAQKKAENFTEVAAVTATCTNAGNNKYFVCNDCNLVRDSKNATNNITATVEENVVYKAMLKHTPDTKAEDYVEEVKATCEVDGQAASYTCKNCDQYITGDVIPATGHSFEGEDAKINATSYAASCTKDAKCSNTNCDYKGGKIVDTAFGHTWVDVDALYVSCTANGIRAHVECDTCGAWALENAEESEKKNDGWVDGYKEAASNNSVYVIKALGHGYNNNWIKVEAKAATHAEAGWVEYYVCGICEDFKTINKNTAVSDADLVDPVFGAHDCPDFGIDTCSRYFVCEDKLDAEGNVIFDGCGEIFDNPLYIPCDDADNDGICDVCKNVACKHTNISGGYCPDCHFCAHEAHNTNGECLACGATVAHVFDATFACSCGLVCTHTKDHNIDLTCPDCKQVIPGEAHDYDANFECKECFVSCQHEAGFTSDACNACGFVCKHESHDYTTEACEICKKVIAHNWVRGEDGSDYCDLCAVTCAHDTHDANGYCLVLCGNKVEHDWNLGEIDKNDNVACNVCGGKTALKAVCPHDAHYVFVDTLNATSYTVCELCGTENVEHIWESEDGEEIKCHCGAEWKVGTVITRGELTVDADIIVAGNNATGNSFAIKAEGEDAVVTIAGGNYNGGSASAFNNAIWAADGAKVVITDGQFTVGFDVNGDINSTIYASKGATIEISGGTFYGVGGWTLNCQNNSNSKIVVTGGTFYNFDPSKADTDDNGAGVLVNYVAEGYHVESEVDGTDTIYTVVAD